MTGIGCHGKMADYLNINSVYALHGRAIPVAEGVKMGNGDLQVVCCVGDGDTYNEGISHLLHAAKRNSDITVLVHDNRVFALTVNQPTLTSPKGFVSTTTPKGKKEEALNPLEVMLSVGATFVARSFAGKPEHLERIILEGMRHPGFSFIEILQPCVAWYSTMEIYNERAYEMEKEFLPLAEAKEKAQEWDYNNGERIPLGIFYKKEKEVFDKQLEKSFFVDTEKILEKSK